MFHEPPIQFLYSSYLLETTHSGDQSSVDRAASGFVIEAAQTVPWIVTNRHVIDIDYRQPTSKYKNFSLSDLLITGRRQDDSVYTFRLHGDAKFFFHQDDENDVVLIEPNCIWDGVPEDQRRLHWHFGQEHLAGPEVFKGSLQPLDLVCYSGYPDQHDKLGKRPIVRSGHIASDPRFDYSWDADHHGACIAYEGFSFPGSSGSPVFAPPRGAIGMPNSRHGFLVGVNAGHIPSLPGGHSGISYFYKSTVIGDIISQNGLI